MKKLVVLLLPLACLPLGGVSLPLADLSAHHPKGVTYKVFQFPPDRIPKIDGDFSDWDIVPDSYKIDGSHLMDTVMGKGKNMDPKDLQVEVKVGWSPKTNRLYFFYKMYDNMHNFRPDGGDIFEVVLDADHSGGRYHSFEDVDAKTEARLKSTTAQNYHIYTPPGQGKKWAWVWGEQQWLIEKPWAEHAFKYNFRHKEPGWLYLEFYITPFNYASFRGPEYSAIQKMEEGDIIGLSWAVLDYDEDDNKYNGFWNLSHHTRMDYTADLLPNFKLMPLEQPKPRAEPAGKASASEPRVAPAETKRVRWSRTPPAKEKTYRARRMKNNPIIDADWNKPAWKGVEPLTLEYYMGEEPAHQPRVQAKAAYDNDYIYVIWRVEDNYVRALRTHHQDSVYRDSCVEFFFTPGCEPKETGYFNLETNCSGVMLMGAHAPGGKNGKLTPEDLTKITVASSLKGRIDPEIAKPTTWTLESKIPLSFLEKYLKVQRPGPGVTWRANFYKCADETSHPHWLTWSPVTSPTPSFHLPEYFGVLSFE